VGKSSYCFKEHVLSIKKTPNLCSGKQLLAVAKKIDPGLSKWRGELLFQLQTAAVVLAQRSYSEGRITKFQAQVFNIKYSEDRIAFNNKVKT
jgi:hypothetical protein